MQFIPKLEGGRAICAIDPLKRGTEALAEKVEELVRDNANVEARTKREFLNQFTVPLLK